MSFSAQTVRESVGARGRVPGRSLLGAPAVVWLFQLIFPTIGLIQIVWFRDRKKVGSFDVFVLVVCLLWIAACILGLAAPVVRRWAAQRTAQLITVYASLAIALFAAEAFCRFNREPKHSKFSPELGWVLVPDGAGIGENGWRRPVYPRERAPNHFRIVCIGDSTTYCLQCEWQETWPHQLETLLNQDPEWNRAHGASEVLNFGVVGYDPGQSLLVLKKFALSYAPDLVIFHLCLNDFAESIDDPAMKALMTTTYHRPLYALEDGRPVLKRERVPLPTDEFGKVHLSGQSPNPFKSELFSFSRTRARSLFRSLGGDNGSPGNARSPIHASFCADNPGARPLVWALVKEMARVSREHGARFLVTLSPTEMPHMADEPPWRVASFLREFEGDAQAAGIPAVNCVPEFFAEGGNERFLPRVDRLHLNPQGNSLIARMTQRWVAENYSAAAMHAAR
jgi:lysophospholipase L1-like esterase